MADCRLGLHLGDLAGTLFRLGGLALTQVELGQQRQRRHMAGLAGQALLEAIARTRRVVGEQLERGDLHLQSGVEGRQACCVVECAARRKPVTVGNLRPGVCKQRRQIVGRFGQQMFRDLQGAIELARTQVEIDQRQGRSKLARTGNRVGLFEPAHCVAGLASKARDVRHLHQRINVLVVLLQQPFDPDLGGVVGLRGHVEPRQIELCRCQAVIELDRLFE